MTLNAGASPPSWGAVINDDGDYRLYNSFQAAVWAVRSAHQGTQTPWIDGNGNGIFNESADYDEAARRGFAYAGTLDDPWPPYISHATNPGDVVNGRGVLRAEVHVDPLSTVQHVWAVIYPPSYQPPSSQEELVAETLETSLLLDQGQGVYQAISSAFQEVGTYRIVFYASNAQGREARPVTIFAEHGQQLFLPLLRR